MTGRVFFVAFFAPVFLTLRVVPVFIMDYILKQAKDSTAVGGCRMTEYHVYL